MKIKEFKDFLKKEKIDFALLFPGDSNINYFSKNPNISSSILIIPKDNTPFFISENLNFENLKTSENIQKKEIKENFVEFLNENYSNKIFGINKNNVSVNLYNKIRNGSITYLDISEQLVNLRKIKTEEEVEKITKSCKIISETFNEVLNNFKFKTEREVEVALNNISKEKGGDFCFKATVASGLNSSNPHYSANSSKLNEGFCVIDFGVKYQGYASDVTRTIYLGKPKKSEIEHYNKVLKAHNMAELLCNPEKKISEICHNVRDFFGDLNSSFIHSLGHGIGLETHESPNISTRSEDVLSKNMCFTLEPGVYFPNKYGIRVENSFLLKDKLIKLTKINEELKII